MENHENFDSYYVVLFKIHRGSNFLKDPSLREKYSIPATKFDDTWGNDLERTAWRNIAFMYYII